MMPGMALENDRLWSSGYILGIVDIPALKLAFNLFSDSDSYRS